jgi:hypothetical protein
LSRSYSKIVLWTGNSGHCHYWICRVANSVNSQVFVTVAVTPRFIIPYGIDDLFVVFLYIYMGLWKMRPSSCSSEHSSTYTRSWLRIQDLKWIIFEFLNFHVCCCCNDWVSTVTPR